MKWSLNELTKKKQISFNEKLNLRDDLLKRSQEILDCQPIEVKGEIAYVTITDEVMSESEVEAYTVAVTNKLNKMDISLGSQISNMFNDDVDNTWLFVGGEEVQGSYNQVQGMRNYVSHFEEYIRWTQSSNTTAGKQRFVINA